MASCSKCGSTGEMGYGSDGLPYCSSCLFYGMNKQCARCMMYLPASELQQCKGMLVCPYCLQDMRDVDRRAAAPRDKERQAVLSYPETCERCGRGLDARIYIWNGRRLCKNCLDYEQETWGVVGGKPAPGAQRFSFSPLRKAGRKSLLESAISDLLALLGLKKKEPEIIVVEPRMPIARAKPMAESAMQRAERTTPKAEGLMKKKKQDDVPVSEGRQKKKKP